MISISLHDPGMHPKTVEAASWEAVPAVLAEHNRTYTTAVFYEGGKAFGHAKREVGEREWVILRKKA